MLNTALQHQIIKHLNPYHPNLIAVFGSYARNTSTHTSDLDLLVSFKDKLNLLDLIGIEQELSELLGIKVDLVTERSVHPIIKQSIQKDLQIILQNEE